MKVEKANVEKKLTETEIKFEKEEVKEQSFQSLIPRQPQLHPISLASIQPQPPPVPPITIPTSPEKT